jgi:hypothetical protein
VFIDVSYLKRCYDTYPWGRFQRRSLKKYVDNKQTDILSTMETEERAEEEKNQVWLRQVMSAACRPIVY